MRAGLGLGATALSFSLRGQILSAMRDFDEADGVDDTRRCRDGLEVVDEDKGTGESVRRGEGNESAEESILDVKAGGDDNDNGGGRERFVSSAVIIKLNEKTIKPNRLKTYDREAGRRSFWTSSGMRTFLFRHC